MSCSNHGNYRITAATEIFKECEKFIKLIQKRMGNNSQWEIKEKKQLNALKLATERYMPIDKLPSKINELVQDLQKAISQEIELQQEILNTPKQLIQLLRNYISRFKALIAKEFNGAKVEDLHGNTQLPFNRFYSIIIESYMLFMDAIILIPKTPEELKQNLRNLEKEFGGQWPPPLPTQEEIYGPGVILDDN